MKTESETVVKMVGIFCRGRHGGKGGLCVDCAELLAYSRERLARCPRRPKPACKACPAHCYRSGLRARIAEVMRYAGPRMLFLHPLLSLRHYLRR